MKEPGGDATEWGFVPRDPALVVFGGGHLGGAVARQGAAAGERVRVASRTSRAHAGLWQRWDALSSDARVPVDGARVVFALSPPRREAEALWEALPRHVVAAWRGGAASVTVCGPAGEGEPAADAFSRAVAALTGAPRTTIVRFGALVGVDDGCVWPLLAALRESGVARLPRGLPPMRPLLLEDAARAVARLAETGGDHVLVGPEILRPEQLGDALTARFGGRWTWRWWGSHPAIARLRAWEGLADTWDDARLGPRVSLAAWIAKLPGLRRKR